MPIVEIDNITKRFGDNQVLNGISLTVEPGQVIAVIGRSGSGKSTMLRCINGLESIDGGSIKVAGHTLTAKHEHLRVAQGCRHGVPELQPVPASDGGRKRHAVAAHRQEGADRESA